MNLSSDSTYTERYEATLRWFARTQDAAGTWAREERTTALALLGFALGGHTDRIGNYPSQVAFAIPWLEVRLTQMEGSLLSVTVAAFCAMALVDRRPTQRERATRHFARLPGGGVAGRRMLASLTQNDPEAFCWYVVAHRLAADLGFPRTGTPEELEEELAAAKKHLEKVCPSLPTELADTELARYLQTLRPTSLQPETDLPSERNLDLLCLRACLGEAEVGAQTLAPLQEESQPESGCVRWKGVLPEISTACASVVFVQAMHGSRV